VTYNDVMNVCLYNAIYLYISTLYHLLSTVQINVKFCSYVNIKIVFQCKFSKNLEMESIFHTVYYK
jgi:hypothetical protein